METGTAIRLLARAPGHLPGSRAVWALALAAVLLPATLGGQELRGSIFAETRLFPRGPAFAGQEGAAFSPSIGLEPEFLWESDSGALRLRLKPFLRLDAHDDDRTHFDVREASLLYLADGWTVQAGIGRVFWGKTEAHHLVDIVNQTDGVEDIDTEDKLGQPMVAFTLERDWGAIDLLVLPYFRERTYPGPSGRLRGPLPVLEEARYASDAEEWRTDLALRWTYFTGGLDLGVSAFYGTSREPRLLVEPRGPDGLALRPFYDVIDQLSIDAQWTRGATLWKLEALTRGGHGDRFVAAVAGLEHTFFQAGPGPADLGVLAEIMIDGRGADAPFTAFDHDVFLGARWALNDRADTSILGGPILDWRTGEFLIFLETERRFGQRWVARLEARWLLNTDPGELLHGLRRDGFLALEVSRHF